MMSSDSNVYSLNLKLHIYFFSLMFEEFLETILLIE